ncbi:hypothetical protein EKE94_17890 [Mesobaculum littorinae]|uniref:HAMP domain-containing protein n=1 Tax=Mesobaculum littorinae TaxID=2486419 RepID=A0A438AD24_9RHOB|nr:cache domain-containing protein [Mesobaculum littorinae]RVV96596.1 hypothetical protein EKE94_17890 [Mesobaculum littorinae]
MFTQKSPNLFRSASVGLVLIAIAVALIVVVPLRAQVQGYERQLQAESMTRSGEAMRLSVSRLIDREWHSISAVARQTDPDDYRGIRNFVDAAARASEAVTWAGFVTAGGTIRAGSSGQYEGLDVSGEKWFYAGRSGQAVSDVWRPEGPQGGAANQGIVTLSVPVADADGHPAGLLVYSLGLSWVQQVIGRAAQELNVDVAVLDREGKVIMSRIEEGPLADRAAAMARIGTADVHMEEDGDGGKYLLQTFPDLVTGDMPDFDWSMVVQVPAAPVTVGLGPFLESLKWSALALVVLLIGGGVIYNAVFLRPILRLAREADRIAQGEDIYPTESSSSEESQRLSAALSLLQGRLGSQRLASLKPAE